MNNQLDIFTSYEQSAAFRNTDTSKAAAESINRGRHELWGKILTSLKVHGPMTPDECAAWLGRDKYVIRPRFSELKALNKIADTGKRTKNNNGKSMIIWGIL